MKLLKSIRKRGKLKLKGQKSLQPSDFSKYVNDIERNKAKKEAGERMLSLSEKSVAGWFLLLVLCGSPMLNFNLSDQLLTNIGVVCCSPIVGYLTTLFR